MNNSLKYNFKIGDYIKLFFLFSIVVIIPFVVSGVNVQVNPDEYGFNIFLPELVDLFSYYKSKSIVILSVIICVVNIMSVVNSLIEDKFQDINIKKVIKDPINIGSAVFLVFTIISTVFSKYKYTSMHGAVSRYESVYVLISYIIIFYVAVKIVKNIAFIKILYSFILLSTVGIGSITINQVFFQDFFTTELGSKLVMGENYNNVKLKSIFEEPYATLYNPNFLGQYAGMMLPIVLIMFIMLPKKSIWKYLSGISAIFIGISLVYSSSTSGFFGFIGSLFIGSIFIFVYFLKKNWKNRKKIGIVIFILFFIIGGVFLIPSVNSKIKMYIEQKFTIAGNELHYPLKSVSVDGNKSSINYNNEIVNIEYDANADNITLNVGSEIISKNDSYPVEYKDIKNIGKITIDRNANMFIVKFNSNIENIMYKIESNGSILVVNQSGKPIEIDSSAGFSSAGYIASSRGYIWSRIVSIVSNKIFIGSGPDTFVLVFPQDEINAKIKYFGSPYISVDKAHNFYLQTIIHTGVISFIGILIIFIYYLVDTVKALFKRSKEENFIFIFKISLLIANISYMISSITNDSNVQVTPTFWCLLGLGIGINRLNATE